MWRLPSYFDHRQKAGRPSHRAPQTVLEASPLTIFLLQTITKGSSTDDISKGPGLSRRPGSPWFAGVRDARRQMEPSVSASAEGAAYEACPTIALGTQRPWGPAFSQTIWEGERFLSWKRVWAAVCPEHALAWPQPSFGRKLFQEWYPREPLIQAAVGGLLRQRPGPARPQFLTGCRKFRRPCLA